jgi:superfamily II DNA or RNA helicase
MPTPTPNALLQLFCPRLDVFAQHWQKGGKSGYMPSYSYDPYHYRQYKMGGGSFQDYPDKKYALLNDEQIAKHLNGQQLIGIYPLHPDNTSWFIAADFDKDHWAEECQRLIEICTKNNLPAYLERSRSGKGGHVWIFFEGAYPALKSRKILLHFLEKTGLHSAFDKTGSFDRLFPNQDFLSGKGLGNLIALPFYKPAFEQGNSCFIDPKTLSPYADQNLFFENIQRVSLIKLDKLYGLLLKTDLSASPLRLPSFSGKVPITLDKEVRLGRIGMPVVLINFLKDEFNIANSEFFIKKNSGKNTWGTEAHIKCLRETESEVFVPRGSIGKIIRFCRQNSIDIEFRDERKKWPMVNFKADFSLRPHQTPAIESAIQKDFGVIVAPPGTGKTVIGLKIIVEKQQPALILVHRKVLEIQWMERIQTFLGIPKHEIGILGKGKWKKGAKITVGTMQSLIKALEKPEGRELQNAFGTIIVDECHHIPALTFRETLSKLHTHYLYGLTATPFRKHSDGKLIFLYLGDIIAEIKSKEIGTHISPKINIRKTELDVPFNPKTDKFEVLSKVLVHDSARNRLIFEDIKREAMLGRKIVVLTERKEHIDALHQLLKGLFECVTLSGDDSETSRVAKWKTLRAGNYQILLTTGQFFGEGTDLPNANCLFLVYPFSFEGKMVQYIGRVQRGEIAPKIYDYHDAKIEYLHRMFLKRNAVYRKIERQATLFDEPEPENETVIETPTSIFLEETIKIPFDALEFQYGCIAFKHHFSKVNLEVCFDFENGHIRPEFDVMKPYFSKILKIRTINVSVSLEIKDGLVISQTAISDDLNAINEELLETVRFRFVETEIIGKKPVNQKSELLDAKHLQNNTNNSQFYPNGEDLLEDLLKNKSVKHFHQLRYLADKHESHTMKLRFVLAPFSFLFLLSGATQYHIILETIDTEEATYIWHFFKDKVVLRTGLDRVERDLGFIRVHGRQAFLETSPVGFGRVLHDYGTSSASGDERKGFVVWKGGVEEKLG